MLSVFFFVFFAYHSVLYLHLSKGEEATNGDRCGLDSVAVDLRDMLHSTSLLHMIYGHDKGQVTAKLSVIRCPTSEHG